MKIGIFDPYLDTLGGGERYMLTIAQCLAHHQIDIFWDDKKIKTKLEERLGLDLRRVNFVKNIFLNHTNLYQRWQATKDYNCFFYMSDGSIPFLFAKKNFLCFMVPFTKKNGQSLINKIKLKKIHQVIAITQFTKRFIDREYGVKSEVVYPPVAVNEFSVGKKRNIILAVGRFSQSLHAKKQEILIDGFRELVKREIKDWRLILIGGLQNEDKAYFNYLKKRASGLPVEFFPNLGFVELKKYYGQAKIFWHATGFSEDEEKHPEKMEHFGIVVVEAMAAGCVPVVIGKGGIPEIVKKGKDGFLWQTKKELVCQTLQLIKSPEKLKKISIQSIKSSKKFSEETFCQKINEIIKA